MNRTAIVLLLVVFSFAGAATAATFLLGSDTDWSKLSAEAQQGPSLDDHTAHDHAQQQLRVVQVNDGDAPLSPGGRLVPVKRLRGKLPERRTVAVVTSDENCQPDARGVSHCTNRLRLQGGRRLVVRHNHRMTEVPCLVPGERVELRGPTNKA
jgi:hypothetical protein